MFTYPTPQDASAAGHAMVTDRFALLLGTTGDADLAARLWRSMTAVGAAFEDVLSVIAAVGVGHLPDFALVELVDVSTSSVAVAVRGVATIDLHGPQRSTYAGTGVGTWVEGSAQQVAGIALALPGDVAGDPLPLGRGVVRTTALRWGTAAHRDDPEAPDADHDVTVDPDVAVDPDDAGRPEDATELDGSESTILGSRRAPVVAEPPPPPRRLVLRLSSGEDVPLDHTVVLGRSPRSSSHPGARTVAVASPRKEISVAHLEVKLEGASLVARDLDSTNGTIVRVPDGTASLLHHGGVVRAGVGVVLDLGDGVTAELIESP